MLSELIFASVERQLTDERRGISCSTLFPCPYRLYLVHTGKRWEDFSPRDLLNMEDGWDQEVQTVRRLERSGIKVLGRDPSERYLEVGRSRIPGNWDGCIILGGEEYVFEHKAMGEAHFWMLQNYGLDSFPGYKAQIQAYMIGKDKRKGILLAKYKDTNDYFDVIEELDEDFIMPIIEWADSIRLDGWRPSPKESKWCRHCGVNCFGVLLDFGRIREASASEMAKRWRRGKQLKAMGEMLIEEARTFFVGKRDEFGNNIVDGLIGDKDVLLVDGLKIIKVRQHRFDVSKEAVLREFGPEALLKVCKESEVVTYRIIDELKEEANESLEA